MLEAEGYKLKAKGCKLEAEGEMLPTTIQNHPKMVPKSIENGPKIVLEWLLRLVGGSLRELKAT